MACDFSILLPPDTRRAVDAGCAALDEVDRLEQLLSVYRDDSELTILNRAQAALRQTTPELTALLRLACGLASATDGAFDAATAELVRIWGFFRGPRRVPSPSEIHAALALCGSRHLYFPVPGTVGYRCNVQFNLGAIGKGYAIDRAIHTMWNGFGIRRALLQAGQSSMFALGPDWQVDLGDPYDPTRTVARIRLRNQALGTSGAANQYLEVDGRRYGHILDPRTGHPSHKLAGATAIARRAAEADALSTAFFVQGTEWVRAFCERHRDIGAVLVPLQSDQTARGPIVLGAVDVEVKG